MNILEKKVILPQLRDARNYLCPLTSAIIIFSNAHGMWCATRVTIKNLRNNFYKLFLVYPVK